MNLYLILLRGNNQADPIFYITVDNRVSQKKNNN